MIQSFSDDSLTQCPECNGEIRKVYTAVGVVFKGSGFYKTDSAKTTKKESVTSETTPTKVTPPPVAPTAD